MCLLRVLNMALSCVGEATLLASEFVTLDPGVRSSSCTSAGAAGNAPRTKSYSELLLINRGFVSERDALD